MTELRRDPILGQWVIVHTDSSWKPKDYDKEEHPFRQRETCQFCPGKEHLTPPEIEAFRPDGAKPNTPGWSVRVVSNKFPALKIEGNWDQRHCGVFQMSNGIGAHEVLIETPDHFKSLADFTEQEMLHVIQKYQSRLIDLSRDKRFKYVVIFKNYGKSAGATLEHPHSQIIALPMVPKYVLEELKGAKRYFEEHHGCVFCDILKQEIQEKERIVSENEEFLVFCPFVPRYPFECWIVPKKHSADFASITPNEQFAFARILKETLVRIKKCLFDPSYNFYLHISPVNTEENAEYHIPNGFHWHMEIVPKLTRVSGFEWGTGFYVARTEPSKAAKYLQNSL